MYMDYLIRCLCLYIEEIMLCLNFESRDEICVCTVHLHFVVL